MSVETVAGHALAHASVLRSAYQSMGDSEMTRPNRPSPSYIQPARSEA